MYRVEKEIKFCFGHRLLHYQGKCHQLHGHNGRAVIVIEGEELDDLGMVVDFKELKAQVIKWVDDTLDHTMLLQAGDPLIASLESLGLVCYVMDEPPTTENIAKLIYRRVQSLGLNVVEVKFWETDASMAAYGNPQRGETGRSASAEWDRAGKLAGKGRSLSV